MPKGRRCEVTFAKETQGNRLNQMKAEAMSVLLQVKRQAQPSSLKENPIHTLAVTIQHSERPKPLTTSPNSHIIEVASAMSNVEGGYRPLMVASSQLDQHKGETLSTQSK